MVGHSDEVDGDRLAVQRNGIRIRGKRSVASVMGGSTCTRDKADAAVPVAFLTVETKAPVVQTRDGV